MAGVIQSNQQKESLFKKLRNNFKLSKQRINQQDNNRFMINLKSSSMIQIKILDVFFFKQLYERIKQLSFIQITKANFEKLVEMIQAKKGFFKEIITIYRTSLDQYLKIRDKRAISEIQILEKEQRKFAYFMLPWAERFLEIYYEKSRKQPLKLSKTQIDEARINFDKQITQFVKQEIEKLMPINNESFKKIHSQKIFRKEEYDIYFQEKDFIDEIMYKIRQINEKYNPYHRENQKNASALPKYFDQLKQNAQIQQFVPTKCINCVQFFYKEVPFNDQCNSLVDYELVPSVKSIKKTQDKDKILENITAFLNRGNGTLLFDCEPTPFGFVPIGYEMTLKEQQAYKYSFQNLFKYIREETYQKSIESEIDFIPLKKNPIKSTGVVIMDPRQPYVQRDYEQNFYVMRVRLKAKSEREFYGCQIDFKTYYYIRKKRKTQQVEGQQVYRQNQKKALNYYRLSSKFQVENMEISMKNNIQVGVKQFQEAIKGQRQYRKNLHQGQCKQTRILSAKSNTKQQNAYQSLGRKY